MSDLIARLDVERLLDNAATASQVRALLRDDDGEETPLREAVRLGVAEPLLAALRQKEAEIEQLRHDNGRYVAIASEECMVAAENERRWHAAEAQIAEFVAASRKDALYRAEWRERAQAAEAQISALRDQQPVAWMVRCDGIGRWFTPSEAAANDYEDNHRGAEITPLYAHPSCVSPDQEDRRPHPCCMHGRCVTVDESSDSPDQSKRPAGSHESADHP